MRSSQTNPLRSRVFYCSPSKPYAASSRLQILLTTVHELQGIGCLYCKQLHDARGIELAPGNRMNDVCFEVINIETHDLKLVRPLLSGFF